MSQNQSRRTFLKSGAGVGAGVMLATAEARPEPVKRYQEGASPWQLALNTSTIRPASLQDKVKVADETGWDAIELWINDLEKYEEEGGDLKALGNEIRDRGLFVPNVIGLWDGLPATQEAFDASLEMSRKRMRMSADVGSRCIAVLPFPDREDFDLVWGIARYRDLLNIARSDYGIVAVFEFIGFLKGVYRMGQAASIAIDVDDPDACILPDTFHLYRGGSGFSGIKHLSPNFIANFHWNDLPAEPAREEMGDAHRIYPGDGVLPLTQALKDLKEIGYTRTLSLELFNRDHWAQDPMEVGRTGRAKMLENIASAGV